MSLLAHWIKRPNILCIENSSANAADATGWKYIAVLGNQSFTFPAFSLATGASVKVRDSANNSGINFHWLDGGGTWNNSKSDPAELYDNTGKLVDVYND
ncbi:MAG: lamin tail domain-containing protein [Acetobacterium sp.]|nr:lamin tail domain-containing protein [Acetobacterium sp.]